jgi:hypothetical protein
MTNPQTAASRALRISTGRLSGEGLYAMHAEAYKKANGLEQQTWREIGRTRQKVFHDLAVLVHDHYKRFGGVE